MELGKDFAGFHVHGVSGVSHNIQAGIPVHLISKGHSNKIRIAGEGGGDIKHHALLSLFVVAVSKHVGANDTLQSVHQSINQSCMRLRSRYKSQ